MNPGKALAAAALALLAGAPFAGAQAPIGNPIQPSSLMIYRVGSGQEALGDTGSAVYIDEYDWEGGLRQSLPVPATSEGSSRRLIASGTDPLEGGLSLSTDGRYLVFSGYDATAPFPIRLSGSYGTTVKRVIGRLDREGFLDTSTALTDFASSGSPYSVASTDGLSFWITGSKGGIRHATLGATTSTLINENVLDPRRLLIADGKLYASSGGTGAGISRIGEGLPVSPTGQDSFRGLPPGMNPGGFCVLDLNPSVSGPDTLYFADDTAGLRKYSLVGGSWVANGIVGTDEDNYRSVIARVGSGEVTLHAIRQPSGSNHGGELVRLFDGSGHNGSFLSTPIPLVSAPEATVFRGLAPAPYSLPDFRIGVVGPAHATVNQPFDYTITVRNTGNAAVEGVQVRFHVPSGLSVTAGPDADGFTGPGAAGQVSIIEFTGGTLAPGATATLVVTCSASVEGTYSTLPGTPVVTSEILPYDANEADNSSNPGVRTVVGSSGPVPTVFNWTDNQSGSWSDPNRWSNELASGTAPAPQGHPNYILNFNASADYVTNNDLESGFFLNQLNFSGSGSIKLSGSSLAFSADGSQQPFIFQKGSVEAQVSAPISASGDANVSVNGSGSLTFGGGFSGTGRLLKSGPGKLRITGVATYPGPLVIGDGTVTVTGDGGPSELIGVDGSFEKPWFGGEGWGYRPGFSGWAMIGDAGIANRYSAFTNEIAEGDQAAFLQGEPSVISRAITVTTPGEYHLNFLGASSPGRQANGVVFKVDGQEAGSWEPAMFETDGAFTGKNLTLNLTAGVHTIVFEGRNPAGGDSATIIDRISLTGPHGQLPAEAAVWLGVEDGVLDIGSSYQTISSLDGGAGTTIINNGSLTVNGVESSTFEGVIRGSGSLVKGGPGELNLGGINTYTGETAVYGGSLVLNAPTLSDTARLRIETQGTLVLNFSGTDVVAGLDSDESSFPPGIYNASNLPGRISGTGSIEVVAPPSVPDIELESPEGILISNGGSFDFGYFPDGTPADDHRILVVKNTGTGVLSIDPFALTITGLAAGNYYLSWSGFDDQYYELLLEPGSIGYLIIKFFPSEPGTNPAQLTIPSNDPDEHPFLVNLTASRPAAPVIIGNPSSREILYQASVTLGVEASGIPAPSYQWYEGQSGDTSNPIPDATGSSFTTPFLTNSTSYWVMASNGSGSAASETATITVAPPSGADISIGENIGQGFEYLDNGDTFDFGSGPPGALVQPRTLNVGNLGSEDLTSFQFDITGPDAADFYLELEGFPQSISSGFSEFFTLYLIPSSEGPKSATLTILSNDPDESPFVLQLTGQGIAPLPTVTTEEAVEVGTRYATFRGTVNPNGYETTVVIEYGNTTAYGSTLPFYLEADDATEAQGVFSTYYGFPPGQTFHYRVVATNAWGTSYGEDRSFTTHAEQTDFTYEIADGQVIITGYTGAGGDVVIPSTIEGLPVVSIGDSAFAQNDSITSLVIPEGVLSIHDSAFIYSPTLASVTLPESLLFIGHQAFRGCSALTDFHIPSGVTSISLFALDLMPNLINFTVDAANTSYSGRDGVLFNKDGTNLLCYPGGRTGTYVVPEGTTRIHDFAFYFCYQLAGVTIPNSVTSIGSSAFEQCDLLTEVFIPESVTVLGLAFNDCSGLVSITVDPANVNYTAQDGVLFDKNFTRLMQYPGAKLSHYIVPATVTEISPGAFLNADSLLSVKLPAGLTNLGSSAFYSCGALGSIVIPPGVTEIGPTTFTYCTNLSSVILSEGLVTIGYSAFEGCSSLWRIIIPSTVTSIGDTAFRICSNLALAVFIGEAPQMGTDVFRSVAAGFVAGYFNGFEQGFTGPEWPGYPVENLGEAKPSIEVFEAPLTMLLSGVVRDFGSVATSSQTGTNKIFRIHNAGYANLTELNFTLSGEHSSDFTVNRSGLPFTLVPDASGEIVVNFKPKGGSERSATLVIMSNDTDHGPFVIGLTGTGTAAPVIITQPVSQALPFGTTEFTLSLQATSSPAPTYQWFRGNSGDTSYPISSTLDLPSFTTSAPTTTTRYWARVTNAHGSTDSEEAVISLLPPPPTNANLVSLQTSAGTLAPVFAKAVTAYTSSVAGGVETITVTPVSEDPQATVRVDGEVITNGKASGPISLAPGNNVILTEVTSRNGTNKKLYTLTVTRATTSAVATLPSQAIEALTVQLKGNVTPGGVATVFFEYGPTTAYGSATPGQVFQGTQAQAFSATLAGLPPSTSFHYRAVATGSFGTLYGEDQTFTTGQEPPVVATGDPSAVTGSAATLVGAVDPKGLPTQVYFQYGLTALYGKNTPSKLVTSAGGILDVLSPSGGLIPGATYHYRIVATSAAGTSYGNDVAFVVAVGSGVTDPIPTTAPDVTTGSAAGIGINSAILTGTVNPNHGTTLVQFQFGATAAYGLSTAVQGVGNGSDPVDVSLPIAGLLPGTTYHYRLVASNSAGPSFGNDGTFSTDPEAPSAVTGNSDVLDSTSVRINGSVRSATSPASVFVDFGTDPFVFTESVETTPDTVSGTEHQAVSVDLQNLGQGLTYYYRVRAVGQNGATASGETKSFDVATLSGLIQQFPETVLPEDREGSLSIVISPVLPTAGWRFLGEKTWRVSTVPATGLTTGDRVIEFRPVAGFVQPPNETVAISSNGILSTLNRDYTASGETGSGSLNVILRPEGITDDTRPFDLLAKWALEGEVDGLGEPLWRDNGSTKTGLVPGNYMVLSKPVTGRGTPVPVTVKVKNGETTNTTITYFVAGDPVGTPPAVVDFDTISSNLDLPYAWVGQFRGDAGVGSGFVVRPGVVATAGHVLFDDGTLSSATGMQWLHRHDNNVQDPVPLAPRGYFLLTGYAAQRAIDNSPGTSTPQSQNLDAAAAYFLTDPGKGGFSGYLASDANDNEFLLSPSLKTLAGYPVDGIAALDQNRMHASAPAPLAFTKGFGRTYTTSEIRSSGGGSGGPLFVQYENGSYYPAAIYLGGTQQTVVRAIDGDVAGLIGFAEASANISAGNTGGVQTSTESIPNGNPLAGDLEVIIQPASAREAGAGWRIQAGAAYLASGAEISDLDPNTYTVGFATIPGFVPPSSQEVEIEAGFLKRITFTYEQIVLPPVIQSGQTATWTRGEPDQYNIGATNSPTSHSLLGALPAGLSFDSLSGVIHGTPTEAGLFPVTMGAANSGGADSKPLSVISLPKVLNQSVTVPFNLPMVYQVVSSESGGGVAFAADNIPPGILFNVATGQFSGTPSEAGTYSVPIRVTRRGATGQAILQMNFTGTAPVITGESSLNVTVEYGGRATLGVTASGLPAPGYQWFIGNSGDTSQPVTGAISATFTTPPVASQTRFWARVASISGGVNSSTFTVSVAPSANANLSALIPSHGALFPAFNAGITSYTLAVPNEVSSITFTPSAEVPQSTVTVNGNAVNLDQASAPVSLQIGANPVLVRVTAGNGVASKDYNLTVTRGQAPTVATEDATDLTYNTAILRGRARPNGPGQVFFEYGTTNAYGNSTVKQEISGSTELDIQSALNGLQAETTYHFRIGLTTGGGTIYGSDETFLTPVAPPLVATGDASDEDPGTVTLVGAVDSSGNPTKAYFEFGLTTAYGFTTPEQVVPPGVVVTDIQFTAEGLVPGTTYHYRLVAKTSAGTWFGDDVVFVAGQAQGGSGVPSGAPFATTGGVADVGTGSVNLLGSANPRGGTTFVRFEYGLTNAYGSSTVSKGIGNGSQAASVLHNVTGLLPGQTYHYRIVASNSAGTTPGADETFTTGFLAPLATTGTASPLSPTSARITGAVRPRGAGAQVFLEYGTDGVTFPNRVLTSPGSVSGEIEVPVTVDLTNLDEGVTYHYRIVAERTGDPASSGAGEIKTLSADALYGLVQRFSTEVAASSHQNIVTVNLLPAGVGAWRFVGEGAWRNSGASVGGLSGGDRLVEYLPVAGYLQPPREQVGIVSGEAPQVLERVYYETPDPGNASVKVVLGPDSVAATSVPVGSRAQWRLKGETAWRDSNTTVGGLPAGGHLIEFKAIPGRNTPPGAGAELFDGETKTVTIIYPPANAPILNPPVVVPFAVSSGNPGVPYSYVGQFRTDAGSQSGFAVKPRVVATTSLAIFNDNTLARNTGMQWLLQRDAGTYEPIPQVPRGSYVFTGYEAQRLSEGTPGTLSLASQNLNVAALYFAEDAGRGGFSGYLASNVQPNEFLQSASRKTLVGYPVNGVADSYHGRMHASPLSQASLGWELGRTYSTAAIRGLGGMEGGPFCVQFQQGAYFPAGIYLGGSAKSLVRAIDGDVVDMFNRAEISGNGGDNNTGGGITHSSFTSIGATNASAIKVTIQPAAARNGGAGWRLNPESTYRLSGAQKAGLTAGKYKLELNTISGFEAPVTSNVTLTAGQLSEITFTYEEANVAPTISNVANLSINEDGLAGPLAVTVFDADNAENSLVLTATSSNTTLVSNANITLGGSGGNRTVTLVPAADRSGSTTITLTVSDGKLSDTDTFVLTVNPVNDAPTLSVIADQSTAINTATAPIAFTVGDVETAASALVVTATSSNLALVPDANIFPGGSGANRNLVITPLVGQTGSSIVTVTVSDGSLTASRTFTLTVTAASSGTAAWRLLHFGTTDNTGDAADNADPDGDGQNNLAEYAAGTDPNLATDVFRISSAVKTASTFSASFPGKAGRIYQLQRRVDLVSGEWETVATALPLVADGEVSLVDPAAAAGQGFYRIVTGLPAP